MWSRSRELLSEIPDVTHESTAAPTLLVYFPGLESLIIGDDSARAELEQTGIPVVSMYEAFGGGKRQNDMQLRFQNDPHYNPVAHGLTAQTSFLSPVWLHKQTLCRAQAASHSGPQPRFITPGSRSLSEACGPRRTGPERHRPLARSADPSESCGPAVLRCPPDDRSTRHGDD